MSIDIFAEHNLVPDNVLDFNKINKAALGNVSGAVVERVMSGDEDPLETYVKAKAIQEVAGNIINELKSVATDEADKYGKEGSSILGCNFVVKNGVTRYSFEHDEMWKTLKEQRDEISKLMKDREKKMIEATKYSELRDELDEVIPPAEIISNGGQVLTISIPKA